MSSEARKTETIPEWKREEVAEIVEFLETYDAVGVVGVEGIPSRQLQAMRRELYGEAELRMSRNTLVTRALEQVGDGLEQLTDYLEGQIGLIATNDNPFGLFQQLEESKTPAPIGAGEISPSDIVIAEGDTGVDPGPFVGELQQVGASARIQDGSIQVVEESTVLEEGGEVSAELANVLSELGIEPKEVGLDLRGVHADEVIFEPDELEIDIDEYRADVESAAAAAQNLSVNASYPTAQTADTLVAKAAGEAKSVGLFAEIESPDVIPELIGRADAQLRALAATIDDDDALPEELQDVQAAAAGATDATAEEQSEADDADGSEDTASAAESEPESDSNDDDEDDGDGAEGLGEMFG
ncbi:MAG: LSU ribosomal protein L10P [uncultured archaeon A07HR60]|nr:MAG: LSU ribosomal protein L10P [uncultured archaeon A07HR60]